MNEKRQEAKRIAQNYFALLARAAGVGWESDNAAEIDYLVDAIIDAAKDEILNGPDLPRLIVRGCEQVAAKRVE